MEFCMEFHRHEASIMEALYQNPPTQRSTWKFMNVQFCMKFLLILRWNSQGISSGCSSSTWKRFVPTWEFPMVLHPHKISFGNPSIWKLPTELVKHGALYEARRLNGYKGMTNENVGSLEAFSANRTALALKIALLKYYISATIITLGNTIK